MNERVQWRQLWRRSNSCAPRRNRYRESKASPPWDDDIDEGFEDRLDEYIQALELGEK